MAGADYATIGVGVSMKSIINDLRQQSLKQRIFPLIVELSLEVAKRQRQGEGDHYFARQRFINITIIIIIIIYYKAPN